MTPKLNAGDRAIIVGEWPEHIGQTVTLVEFCPKGSWHTHRDQPFMMDRDCWAVCLEGVGTMDVAEWALLPLKPPGVLHTRSRETELC